MTRTEAKRLKLAKTLEEAHAIADRVLAMARSRKPTQPRAPGRSRDERREERNERMTAIREAVMARAGKSCEWCQGNSLALEAHHVLHGTGTRRSEESPDTVAAICWDCHRRYHRGELDMLLVARGWAQSHGFAGSLAAINRRIAKVEAMRRPSVPVRIEAES